MSNKQGEYVFSIAAIILAFMLMYWLASGSSACIKTDNDVIFVEDLTVAQSHISYTYDGINYKSNNATYVYADNPASCDEIFPQGK